MQASLMPLGGGALFVEGVGAGAAQTVAACSTFSLYLKKNGNSYPALPFYVQVSLLPPPDSSGGYTVPGILDSQVPWQVPAGFGPYDIVHVTQGGAYTGGVCAPAQQPPPVYTAHICPAGYQWDGSKCAPIPAGQGLASAVFGGAGSFQQICGHRVERFVYTTSGNLPVEWTTAAAVQAQLNAAFPGQYTVVASDFQYPATGSLQQYPGATDIVQIVCDYCGPSKGLPQNAVVSDGTISVTTYLKDLNVSPVACATPCAAAAPTGGMSAGAKVALVAGGTVVVVGIGAAIAKAKGWI